MSQMKSLVNLLSILVLVSISGCYAQQPPRPKVARKSCTEDNKWITWSFRQRFIDFVKAYGLNPNCSAFEIDFTHEGISTQCKPHSNYRYPKISTKLPLRPVETFRKCPYRGEVPASLLKRAREFGSWLKVMAVKYGRARTHIDKEGMPYICFENNRVHISTFNECQYIPVSKSKGACLSKEYKAVGSPNARYHKIHRWIGQKAHHFTVRCSIKRKKQWCGKGSSCWSTSWDKCKWKAVSAPKTKPGPAPLPLQPLN